MLNHFNAEEFFKAKDNVQYDVAEKSVREEGAEKIMRGDEILPGEGSGEERGTAEGEGRGSDTRDVPAGEGETGTVPEGALVEGEKIRKREILNSGNATESVGTIKKHITEKAEELRSDVFVADTYDSLSAEQKSMVDDSHARGEACPGWYDTKSGRVVLYMPDISNRVEAEKTILHEVVSHKGLRGLLGKEQFNKICELAYKGMDDATRKKYTEKYGDDILEIGDEYMASIAEGGIIKPSIWNRIKSYIKSALRKIGIDVNLSDNDIKELLWRSRNRLTGESEKDSQILSKLNDIKSELSSIFATRNQSYEKRRRNSTEQGNGVNRAQGDEILQRGRVREYVSAEREKNNALGDIAMLEEGMADELGKHSDSRTTRENRLREEKAKESLLQAAQMAGKKLSKSEIESLGKKIQEQTGESDVYVDEKNGIVYKVKDPFKKLYMKGHDAFDVIYEHIAHNILFPTTKYSFIGVGTRKGESSMVLAQDFIPKGEVVSDSEVDAYMEQIGFEKKDRYSFTNGDVTITDVYGQNVFKGDNGELYFVDPVIKFNKPAKEVLDNLAKSVDSTGALRNMLIGEKGASALDAEYDTNVFSDTLKEAERMEKEGADINDIWRKTGWEKGKDGKWRTEIPDMKIKGGSVKLTKETTLGKIFEADELFKAHPDIADVKIKRMTLSEFMETEADAMYDDEEGIIKVMLGEDKILGDAQLANVLHEVQHAIQYREGFTTGSSETKVKWNSIGIAKQLKKQVDSLHEIVFGKLNKECERIADEKGWSKYMRKRHSGELDAEAKKNLMNNDYEFVIALDKFKDVFGRYRAIAHESGDPFYRLDRYYDPMKLFEIYKIHAGEVEARNVQRRHKLTDEQRKKFSPFSTEDYERDEQIIGTDSGISYHAIEPNDKDLTEDDKKAIEELNSGKTKTVYRAMQVIDGKLYPPMAAKIGDKLVEGSKKGDILKADERSGLIKMANGKPLFVLDKGGKDATGKKGTRIWIYLSTPLLRNFVLNLRRLA